MPNHQRIFLLRTIKIILLGVFTLISIAPLAWILLSSFNFRFLRALILKDTELRWRCLQYFGFMETA